MFLQRRRLSSVTKNDPKRWFEVVFKDGSSGKFPFVWLRDVCLDPKNYSIGPAMRARIPMMKDFDVTVSPCSHSVKSSGLGITWSDGHQSFYPTSWLKSRNLSDSKVLSSRKSQYLKDTVVWNENLIKKLPVKVDHNEFISEESGVKKFLDAVCRDGIGMLVNGPQLDVEEHQNVVQKIGDRIGLIHQTHFGEIFSVCTKPDASNMAYASGKELPYHTDFPSLSDPPQLQFLHMTQPAKVGGKSMFVDGFQVAEILRKHHKWAFETLSKTYLEFIEIGYDMHEKNGKEKKFDFRMMSQQKTISLRGDGTLKKVQFGNAMRSWAFATDPEEIQLVYDALKLFTDLCYRPENQLVFEMKKGESVLWANTRLLHARSAYDCDPGVPRVLHGCYFSWDIVKSRLRLANSRVSQDNDVI
ncbi:unnamed protein product [Bursaphelenchus xylophilus]|uniref:(pine wood nematode) hypothetical protein n=1 Tax=Bursaphelenchus xylophilus TaxID=6326 RepID=A0A1I7S1S3_BURXY|nr:unnamed protein product [Bursaphelenchus xylophilus]CAG9089871.1 unnamed protein product [Bursaphelenchus xylophilus]